MNWDRRAFVKFAVGAMVGLHAGALAPKLMNQTKGKAMAMQKPYKILAINGSHRQKNGVSQVLLNRFLKGSRAAGAECEIIYPSRMDINLCTACYRCIVKTPGICFQKDDMAEVIKKMEQADLLLLGAPVYFDTMSSGMKRLFDRLMPTLGPVFEFRDGRTYHLTTGKKAQNVVTILLCGNPERESLRSISATFRRLVKNMGGRLQGEFLFTSSQMVISQAGELHAQLDALEKAGKQVVLRGQIDQAILATANQEYVTDFEADIAKKNKAFAEMMKQNGLGI